MKNLRTITVLLVVSLLLAMCPVASASENSLKQQAINMYIDVLTAGLDSYETEFQYIEEADTICGTLAVNRVTKAIWDMIGSDGQSEFFEITSKIASTPYSLIADSLDGTTILLMFTTEDGSPISMYINDVDVTWMLN